MKIFLKSFLAFFTFIILCSQATLAKTGSETAKASDYQNNIILAMLSQHPVNSCVNRSTPASAGNQIVCSAQCAARNLNCISSCNARNNMAVRSRAYFDNASCQQDCNDTFNDCNQNCADQEGQ
jgi:hypothetical protein